MATGPFKMSNTYNVAETFLCKQLPRYQSTKGVWGYSGTNSGYIRAVGFLPNNFRSVDVLICACVQMFALRAFVSLRIAIFLSFPATSYTFCMYTYIYIYIFVCISVLFFFFVSTHPNFLARAELFCCIFFVICNNCQQAVLIKMETVQRALSVTDSVVS